MGDGVPVQVDIQTLENAKTWLDGLKQSLDGFISKFDDIGAKTGADVDNSPFGGPSVSSRTELWTKHRQHWQTSYDTYRAISDELQKMVDGTQKIIDNYHTTEERNAANANDINNLLGDTVVAGTRGTSTPMTPSADTGTGTSSASSSSNGGF